MFDPVRFMFVKIFTCLHVSPCRCLALLRGVFSKTNSEVDCDIQQQVEAAVVSSVEDWYNFILDKMPIESNRVMRVKNLTNLANILGQVSCDWRTAVT